MKKITSLTNQNKMEPKILKVLIDSNLILDVLLERQCRTLDDTENLLTLVSNGEIQGYITGRGLADISMLTEKLHGGEEASTIKRKIEEILQVCDIDRSTIIQARELPLSDFESNLQLACLMREQLDAIITVNPFEFLEDPAKIAKYLPVFEPDQFLNLYHGIGDDLLIDCVDNIDSIVASLKKSYEIQVSELIDERLPVGDGWVLGHYMIHAAQDNFTEVRLTLLNLSTKAPVTKHAQAAGSIEASCKALDDLVSELYPDLVTSFGAFDSFTATNIEGKGSGAPVLAKVTLKYGDSQHESEYQHKNLNKAVFFAYVKGVDDILRSRTADRENSRPPANKEIKLSPKPDRENSRSPIKLSPKPDRENSRPPTSKEILIIRRLLGLPENQALQPHEEKLLTLFLEHPNTTYQNAGRRLNLTEEKVKSIFDGIAGRLRRAITANGGSLPRIEADNLHKLLKDYCSNPSNKQTKELAHPCPTSR